MSGRHVLVVSWWFPPLSGGGVHRPHQFVRHLVRTGHRVTVLTGVPPRGERLDEALEAKVPAGVRVVRVPLLDPFRAWAWWKGRRGAAPAAANRTAGSVPASNDSAAHGARWRDLVTETIALPDRWLP